MSIEYCEDRQRWEAEEPAHRERPLLAQLGFAWDQIARSWYAPSDDVALRGMEA